MSTEIESGISIVPQVEPVVMVPTDGGQGEIALEFPGASGSAPQPQPTPPPQPSAAAPPQPGQPSGAPVGVPAPPPAIAPAVAQTSEPPPPDSRYLTQQVNQLQQQVMLGQQAMSQLQQLTTRIPQLEQALVQQNQTGQQTKEDAEIAGLMKQTDEYFGDAAPMVKSLMAKVAEINTRRMVEPIYQQFHALQQQQTESAKDGQCRMVAQELIDRGVTEQEAVEFVDTVRRHEATQQLDPNRFAQTVRELGFKYLFGRQQASGVLPVQPSPQPAAIQAAAPIVAGVSPTIPAVPSTVLAAEAAKAGGRLQAGTGSAPGPVGQMSQSDIESSILKNAWEAQKSGW